MTCVDMKGDLRLATNKLMSKLHGIMFISKDMLYILSELHPLRVTSSQSTLTPCFCRPTKPQRRRHHCHRRPKSTRCPRWLMAVESTSCHCRSSSSSGLCPTKPQQRRHRRHRRLSSTRWYRWMMAVQPMSRHYPRKSLPCRWRKGAGGQSLALGKS